jgi:hypothetical protein
MSPSSYPVWKTYLDFIRSWPETGGAGFDPGRKLLALRKIYQRALSIPMDNLEAIWREYEQLEKSTGEVWADRVLPEYNDKYLHAAAVFKERYKYTSLILFDRMATPPTQSLQDLQQLDMWNKYVKFEMSNPDNLSDESLRMMMHLIYDQCLCCLLFYPEIWMSLAKFELGQKPSCVSDARVVLRESIEVIPESALLRVTLAELEEMHGGMKGLDTAREVLKFAFESIPCPFTFAAFQRFVRRVDGITAARKLFSETLPLRAHKIFGYELFMVHAEMELDVNSCPEVALKVLNLAKISDPTYINDVDFLHMLVRVLMRLGDLEQIREVFETVLGNVPQCSQTNDTKQKRKGKNSAASSADASDSKVESSSTLSLKDQLQLWEYYLVAETTLGLSSVARLDELKQRRDKVRVAIDDVEKAKSGVTSRVLTEDWGSGLFTVPRDICERYDYIAPLPQDSALRNRSRGRALLMEVSRQETERLAALKEAAYSRGHHKHHRDRDRDTQGDADGHLSGVPALLREFLSRLPGHSGPAIDADAFIKHIKGIILPPRPSTEESDAFGYGHRKRPRPGDRVDQAGGAPEEEEAVASAAEEEEEDDILFDVSLRDDVFRRRQRERLLL